MTAWLKENDPDKKKRKSPSSPDLKKNLLHISSLPFMT
jgi:hypothetical protein